MGATLSRPLGRAVARVGESEASVVSKRATAHPSGAIGSPQGPVNLAQPLRMAPHRTSLASEACRRVAVD